MFLRNICLCIAILAGYVATAQLEGEVTDQNNKALANVIITATDHAGKLVDSTRTDSSGLYIFRKLEKGRFSIEAKSPGFRTVAFKNIEIEQAADTRDPWDDSYYSVRLDIVMQISKSR